MSDDEQIENLRRALFVDLPDGRRVTLDEFQRLYPGAYLSSFRPVGMEEAAVPEFDIEIRRAGQLPEVTTP